MSYFQNKDLDRAQSCIDLAVKKGASAASIIMQYKNSYSCAFSAGRLKQTANSETLAYNLDLVADGRRSSVSGNVIEELDEMLERALQLAKIGAPAYFSEYPVPGKYKKVKTYSESIKSLTRERLIDDCSELVEHLKTVEAGMDIEAAGSRSEQEALFVNSAGLSQIFQGSNWSLNGGFTRLDGEDMLFGWRSRYWREVNELYDISYLKNKLSEDFENGSRIANLQQGAYPVLLAPSVSGQFIAPLISALNGRNVFKGISPLKDKLGQTVFDSSLSIYDRPHIDYAPGSSALDDAGLATQDCTLIEDGKVNMFLYDYDTAHMADKKPTAHTACSPYNIRVKAGETTTKDLLANMGKAVYIHALLGFGQSNLANGDFSANVAIGYLVENGEIKGRIKDSMIAGNIFELFAGNIQISSDLEDNSKMPHILFPKMNVTNKK